MGPLSNNHILFNHQKPHLIKLTICDFCSLEYVWKCSEFRESGRGGGDCLSFPCMRRKKTRVVVAKFDVSLLRAEILL